MHIQSRKNIIFTTLFIYSDFVVELNLKLLLV